MGYQNNMRAQRSSLLRPNGFRLQDPYSNIRVSSKVQPPAYPRPPRRSSRNQRNTYIFLSLRSDKCIVVRQKNPGNFSLTFSKILVQSEQVPFQHGYGHLADHRHVPHAGNLPRNGAPHKRGKRKQSNQAQKTITPLTNFCAACLYDSCAFVRHGSQQLPTARSTGNICGSTFFFVIKNVLSVVHPRSR